MTDSAVDGGLVRAAIALASRAPSTHNTQPWICRLGATSLHLYADPTRWLPATDPDRRDLDLRDPEDPAGRPGRSGRGPQVRHPGEPQFMETFKVEKSDLSATGKSTYFVLEPGFVAIFEGKEEGKKATLTITVTDQTRVVDGVETRVVEEKETADGELVEQNARERLVHAASVSFRSFSSARKWIW